MVHLQQVVQLRPDFKDGFLVSVLDRQSGGVHCDWTALLTPSSGACFNFPYFLYFTIFMRHPHIPSLHCFLCSVALNRAVHQLSLSQVLRQASRVRLLQAVVELI